MKVIFAMTQQVRFGGLVLRLEQSSRAGLFYPLGPGGASTGGQALKEDFAAAADGIETKILRKRETTSET
jgi:hypothetical protein